MEVSVASFEDIFDRVMEGKGIIAFRDLEALLTRLGFTLARTSGSHRIYRHPKVSRHINIQPIGKDAKPYQIRQLRSIIKEFNLKLEDRP